MRKVIFFSGSPRQALDIRPFDYGKKNKTYEKIFDKLIALDTDTYFARTVASYHPQERSFLASWKYVGNGNYEVIKEEIVPDYVWDRSGTSQFPPDDMTNVLNIRDFKLLVNDKWATYEKISKFMPLSALIESVDDIGNALKMFSNDDWVIIKPATGMKGNNVKKIKPELNDIIQAFKEIGSKSVLQAFVDTSGGIPEVCDGIHDLRIVYLNQKIIWSAYRVPSNDDFRANVALGGIIRELPKEKIPPEVIAIGHEIGSKLSDDYDRPLFSIDFGIGRHGPIIFELNDTIGLPQPDVNSIEEFTTQVANRLANITL